MLPGDFNSAHFHSGASFKRSGWLGWPGFASGACCSLGGGLAAGQRLFGQVIEPTSRTAAGIRLAPDTPFAALRRCFGRRAPCRASRAGLRRVSDWPPLSQSCTMPLASMMKIGGNGPLTTSRHRRLGPCPEDRHVDLQVLECLGKPPVRCLRLVDADGVERQLRDCFCTADRLFPGSAGSRGTGRTTWPRNPARRPFRPASPA